MRLSVPRLDSTRLDSTRLDSPALDYCCILLCTLLLESYVTTDGQSASLSWNKAPIWGLRPDFYYRRTVAGLLMWGALYDERTGLSFTIAAGSSQRSHSRVRVPWDSGPYFTVSDLRLPISSPPTTRRVTMGVFDPASTRVTLRVFSVSSYKPLARTPQKTPSSIVNDACLLVHYLTMDVILSHANASQECVYRVVA
jgi:hypothetical protein